MKRLFLFITALMLSVGMWAETENVVNNDAKGNLTVEDFVVNYPYQVYSGIPKEATVTLKEGITGAGEITVTYKQDNAELSYPTNAGEYDVYAAVTEGDNYNAFEAAKVGTLIIDKATPTANLFTYTAPQNLTYDGNPKTASVVFDSPLGRKTGMGNVTVKYNGSTQAPTAVGDYTVSIDIEEGLNFVSASDVSYPLWEFTIIAPFVPTLINVPYIDENGETKTVDAWEVGSVGTPITWDKEWYVVKGNNITTEHIACSGAVHLILADGAKLTTNGSIKVSESGNSLTIYGQTAQSGQLEAHGGYQCAGIGGNDGYLPTGSENSSNITINGGIVYAYGGYNAAGIGGGYRGSSNNITINGGKVYAYGGDEGAGIGGGQTGDGNNITINGGKVTAIGKLHAAGIGGGDHGSGNNITINGGDVTANSDGFPGTSGIGSGGAQSSNIKVETNLILKAGNVENPTDEIEHSSTEDIASKLEGKLYVTIVNPIPAARATAIAEINAATEGVTDEKILAIANTAKTNIGNATTLKEIDSIKTLALTKIDTIAEITTARQGIQNAEINAVINDAIIAINNAQTATKVDDIRIQIITIIGYINLGKAEAFGEMVEPCEDCPSIEVTRGDKTVKLYNPEKVKFKKE